MIYVVEDDKSIRELVVYTLNSQKLPARGFPSAAPFWQAVGEESPALAILDIMLPGEDGLSILKRLRLAPATRRLPVLLLTARDSEFDKVVGLDAGADDYLAKPFGMMELLSRIRALLRRAEEEPPGEPREVFRLSGLCVDPARRTATVDGRPVTLTLKEFDLLCCLLHNQGLVLTRDQLLNAVWGYGFDGESRTVDVHVRTLRQKLGPSGALIETVRGVGYKIGEGGEE